MLANGTLEDDIKALALHALKGGNPYIAKSITYYVGSQARHIWGDKSYTTEELNREYIKTAEKDVKAGYDDRKVGYYDKWYRYCHADDGRAYDLGVKRALIENDTPSEMRIIPCAH